MELITLKNGIIFLAGISLTSCSSDETQKDQTPSAIKSVSEFSIEDRANNANASDIFVQLTKPANDGASEYRIIIGEAQSLAALTVNDANSIVPSAYTTLPQSGSNKLFLDAIQTDINGNEIIENKEYEILILSVAADSKFHNSLSGVSPTFILTKQNYVETFVNNLPANDALAIDQNGNLYASNFGTWSSSGGSGDKILTITKNGDISTYVSNLNGPLDIFYSESGSLYVIDDNNGTRGNIIKITNGQKEQIADISGWPGGIAEDNNGNLYISNYSNASLHKIKPDKSVELLSSDTRLQGAVGIVYHNTQLYLANYNNGKILKSDLNGNIVEHSQLSVTQNFGLGYMTVLGNYLYATGIGTNEIHKISISTGTSEIIAGTGTKSQIDGVAEYASFSNPNGIISDVENNILYVLDWGNPAIRKIHIYE